MVAAGCRRGALLWEMTVAVAVLAGVGGAALAALQSEGKALRAGANRASALGAASAVLEALLAGPLPTDGEHERASRALETLPRGTASVRVDHEAPGGPGLARVRVTVSWEGVDRKPRRLSLDALIPDRGDVP